MTMSFENIVIGVCFVMYAAASISCFAKGNLIWGIIWGSYAIANICLILAQSQRA